MGYRSKYQTFANGTTRGGKPLLRGQLHYLLTNTTYPGLIRHKDEVDPGMHPAIVDQDFWDRKQARLQQRTTRPRGEWGRLAAQVAGRDPSTVARGEVARPSGGS
jgi:hypothetical protein